jgi:hypothetical protein
MINSDKLISYNFLQNYKYWKSLIVQIRGKSPYKIRFLNEAYPLFNNSMDLSYTKDV